MQLAVVTIEGVVGVVVVVPLVEGAFPPVKRSLGSLIDAAAAAMLKQT